MYQRKDLLGLKELTADEISLILDTAVPMKEIIQRDIKKVPTLRGKSMVTLFYEPSTRTKTSFEMAGKYLSADTSSLTVSASSVVKGESLIDTGRTIEVMGTNVIVIRHQAAGAPHLLAKNVKARVINAGDGMHEHPTQGLLDLFTMREKKGDLGNLTVAILGDIMHSRVARSNIWGLTKFGAKVHVVGPSTLIPKEIKQMGVKVFHSVEEAVKNVDVINVLRVQRERQKKGLIPSLKEYAKVFGLDKKRASLAKPDALIMHPGPMNRGVEIMPDVYECEQSVVDEQVTNGVAVRMAVLYLLMGGKGVYEATN
ncbi:MAG: aspartate carbamoyltransferase catalytic subunit [Zhaonellaceae bacterium]|jgi:aspartate carbamoyltransferase catalytic subunit|nr:aspartate carbamoyltransferase catalytic subunit [Clostridia bacterium]